MTRTQLIYIASVVALIALVTPAPRAIADSDPVARTTWDGKALVAHEWGTFTSVQGSDGVVLDGLQHEETDLPSFVYDLRDRAGITGVSPKMETPVIYFYAPDERRVRAEVRFPRGTITQWYPAAHRVNHQGATSNGVMSKPDGRVIDEHKDGHISWGRYGDLLVMDRSADAPFPAVTKTDPWRFCRQTAANPLRVCTLNAETTAEGKRKLSYEHERCLFYRGLGDFRMPLQGRVLRERVGRHEYEVTVKLDNTNPAEALGQVFLVWVKDGRIGFHYLPSLKGGKRLELTMPLAPLAKGSEALVHDMARRLTETGLYADEALAMTRTWQHGYFQEEGLRVLYVLPQPFMDRELPLAIRGAGKNRKDKWSVVRTFVGRTELLSPEREAEIGRAVTTLAAGDATSRVVAQGALKRWGRFALPYLRRAEAIARSAAAKQLINRSIAELRLVR